MCPMPVCFLTTLYARVNTEYFTALTVQCYVDIDPTVNIYELTRCLWCFCQWVTDYYSFTLLQWEYLFLLFPVVVISLVL